MPEPSRNKPLFPVSHSADSENSCSSSDCSCQVGRRDFFKTAGLGAAGLLSFESAGSQALIANSASSTIASSSRFEIPADLVQDPLWPTLCFYKKDSLARIALPLGGIGTGTVSLGGRGDLCDWEIMNRPAKGFVPLGGGTYPFFSLFARQSGHPAICRILEGPLESFEFEGSSGSPSPNQNLPRFREAMFAAAYPLGRVILKDADIPLEVHLKAFNPFLPTDPEESGLPLAALCFELHNLSGEDFQTSICGTLPNFIGIDGWETKRDWNGENVYQGALLNHNKFRRSSQAQGIYFFSEGVDPKAPAWGTMALVTLPDHKVSYRTSWAKEEWGFPLLDFWDDFSQDGRLEEREQGASTNAPAGSLVVETMVPAQSKREVWFLLAWHFPNRYSWTPKQPTPHEEDWVGNYYTSRFRDAWDVAEKTLPRLPHLLAKTTDFVGTFCRSDLPQEVKEAALFNVSTLRTQTCFRTPDGRFFGWEGCANHAGCCHGSCTHVWNYEQATPYLFGTLAAAMREVEFAQATTGEGLMSFRVNLPLGRSHDFNKAAADGQMGCIMKMYRDWQLSGNEVLLKQLWPRVRKALEFCWIPGGWDANRDGVMEGCQHNTMDVEYYGPNPQMGIWYLGALRAAEEMARHLREEEFAQACHTLFEKGKTFLEKELWNGEYFEHKVQAPRSKEDIAPSLLVGMGASDITHPDYQLAAGCLVDQLVGQFLAHVCGLGYLVDPDRVRKTLQSILKYNRKTDLHDHFNSMRGFALDSEGALLMASYPKGRPRNPFPYFTEVMTGFEYTAAVGMLYEEMKNEGLDCIRMIRDRYDGHRRNPFDEAECGHHYARAMASWAAVLALTGFHYSGVTGTFEVAPRPGSHFWSTGFAWGSLQLEVSSLEARGKLRLHGGNLSLSHMVLTSFGKQVLPASRQLTVGEELPLLVLKET
jgi:non-lysosomal glucosylceramidase